MQHNVNLTEANRHISDRHTTDAHMLNGNRTHASYSFTYSVRKTSSSVSSRLMHVSFCSIFFTRAQSVKRRMLLGCHDDPTSYRPISLLCCCCKLLERLLLTRLAPIFESVMPPEQAGFRKKRNACDQVLALTSYIESEFQKKLKTGAVLIDLSAAYDTVWQAGLKMKLSKAVKCRTTIRLITSLISQRNFRVFLGNQVSRKRMLKNGLPQGSVLASCTVVLQHIHQWPPTNWVAEVWICWWLDPCYTIKDLFTSWEYTVSWYRTPERVLWLLEAAPKRKKRQWRPTFTLTTNRLPENWKWH